MTGTELFSTTGFVADPRPVKFYVDPALMASCEAIFERQGIKLSKGIERLIETLVKGPPELVPILLGQAHDEAAVALAESILNRQQEEEKRKMGPAGMRVAATTSTGPVDVPPKDGRHKSK